MPQMAPLWWNMLYLMFIIMLLLTMNIIYFIFFNKSIKKNYSYKTYQSNWKW
uniref:ATP synthase F0 subunit 8 n=1 Tax=Cavelerius yunnanensis TaxID=2969358 RepID=UPI002066E575|nr:ATP synthase F0 subunit 8 [Cavelerius yunnanensis]UPL65536.1 ATPase subunit 8 [Cavelerius excavatus]UUJ37741.1 ATP synthase F0 subunit 8 [Cavelerius yunnanensis]